MEEEAFDFRVPQLEVKSVAISLAVSEYECEAAGQKLVCWESEGKGPSFCIVGFRICGSCWRRDDEIGEEEVCDAGD